MRNFIIGVVVGVLLCATGIYTAVKSKAKEVVTQENIEKVAKDFQKAIK